ncbi:MAG: phosphate starvation-inducible protein PsiF [Burkholderiales bacterium]|nr:phosphate starvation-inducible protein PsiF [Burkholderiales bacterium]GIK87851.1 MAG: phosphate starvation-inducible protein PsiF [Betaproteobacteria bacterium]
MRTLLAVGLAVLAAAVAMPAAAQGNPQQERMKVCNEKAAGKSGDERKKFMSECLSGKEPAKMTQQEKMTACNKKAGAMKGDERKKFMSECLKN